ncbi:sigma-70 family RNA polymerase sigma factor [Roseovarius sp. A21]|uniref:Sigma-70 family RNA polymerase sigma factor n=1 Tax=Roseovarius bejariae TaxID=2576383 RepID=A0A844CYV3_9RHOB|nr:sigma-70 family RNA polymerase sigma factor [Roseovarius bejariae]MRU14018.1 sigma-70 family RNA polymerase sigma factor [Roseovarius bejariae]
MQQPAPTELTALMPVLTRAALRIADTPDEAQDLTQEVLLKLWLRINRGEEITNLRGYALAALRNQMRQGLRDRKDTDELDEDNTGTAPDVFACLALSETRAMIDKLPPDQAQLMKFVLAGESSPAALARQTGWPLGTVMSRLSRARAQLRRDMGLSPDAPVKALL